MIIIKYKIESDSKYGLNMHIKIVWSTVCLDELTTYGSENARKPHLYLSQ